MSKEFTTQYNAMGLKSPEGPMSPSEKAEVIFHAACKKLGLDPTALPVVHHLPEEYQVFPVAAFKLQVIRDAITDKRKADWNNSRENKYGSWFYLDNPGFRFYGAGYAYSGTYAGLGSRLCTFTEEDEEFLAIECIAIWADFSGGVLPE